MLIVLWGVALWGVVCFFKGAESSEDFDAAASPFIRDKTGYRSNLPTDSLIVP